MNETRGRYLFGSSCFKLHLLVPEVARRAARCRAPAVAAWGRGTPPPPPPRASPNCGGSVTPPGGACGAPRASPGRVATAASQSQQNNAHRKM
jgi:hypothetical protein